MASIYGTSKEWGAIKSKLAQVQLSAEHPSEIEPILDRCQSEYEQQIKQVRQKLKTEITQLKQEILQVEEKTQANKASVSENKSLEIEQSEATLEVIKQDRSVFNLVRNFFRSRRENEKLAGLRTSLKDEHSQIESPLHAKEIELQQKKAQIDELARQECHEVLAQIEVLRGILASPELVGASAEAELLDYLRRLPDQCHIINNVVMKVDKGVLFEGIWLINAQIDQLVLTPSGLFAIGIKSWVKQPGEKEATSDPYDPIKRAAQLCYEMIKAEFPGTTVRSILAYRGRPPEATNPGIVKALPLSEVPTYITWFKDNTLSERTIHLLLAKLTGDNALRPNQG